MQYVGIDWAYRRAAWCALSDGGAISGEGMVPADEDGLARLVLTVGPEVRACVEMMSGAVWVRDRLAAAGWAVEGAHARKVRDIAPLACRPTRSMRGCWPSCAGAISCPRCGCPRSRTVRCASGCAGGCISCGCARRRATASSGC